MKHAYINRVWNDVQKKNANNRIKGKNQINIESRD